VFCTARIASVVLGVGFSARRDLGIDEWMDGWMDGRTEAVYEEEVAVLFDGWLEREGKERGGMVDI
jgi:hypothetical protein